MKSIKFLVTVCVFMVGVLATGAELKIPKLKEPEPESQAMQVPDAKRCDRCGSKRIVADRVEKVGEYATKKYQALRLVVHAQCIDCKSKIEIKRTIRIDPHQAKTNK